jgi:hypothetical protein
MRKPESLFHGFSFSAIIFSAPDPSRPFRRVLGFATARGNQRS